ncbi:MAG: DUF6057 family protein [Muribaculum sp.]|nr:DUF6057 family protein [Muribaculum sp.]
MENIIHNIKVWLKKPFNMTVVAFAVFSYIMLPILNRTMLRWFDEMSLFEPNMLFWKQTTSYPAGFLKYIGTFLIQFLYYPWLGSTILIVLWLLIVYASRKAFRIQGEGRQLLLFVVPLCLLCSVAGMDEGWLTMSSQGYFFSQTIGTLISILLFWLYRSIRPLWGRIILIIAITLTYLPLGFYSVLTVGMCSVYEIFSAFASRRWIRIISPVIGIVVMAVVPWICYALIPGISVDNDALYLKGLPEFSHENLERWLEVTFGAIAVALSLFAIQTAINRQIFPRKPLFGYSAIIIVAVCVVSASMSVSKQVKCSIEMLRYIDRCQWTQAFNVINESDVERDFNMMILNNLTRKRLGLPLVYGIQRPQFNVEKTEGGENVYDSESAAGIRREGITTNVFLNVPVNYHLGKANNTYRWSMEHTVKYGKRVFFLKYMVRASLLNGDYELARKYNDILLSTIFHRSWAEHYRRFIDHPELMKTDPEFAGIPDYVPPATFL